jgi:two-component SAPR family response regulator
MRIRNVIKKYKTNIELSLNGEKDFQFIYCPQGCMCIMGIQWDDLKFENPKFTVKNGHQFTVNWKFGNELEFLYYVVIQRSEEIKKQRERNTKLNKLL